MGIEALRNGFVLDGGALADAVRFAKIRRTFRPAGTREALPGTKCRSAIFLRAAGGMISHAAFFKARANSGSCEETLRIEPACPADKNRERPATAKIFRPNR